MAQLSDDCFAGADKLLPIDEALADLHTRLQPLVAPEVAPLAKSNGRILAQDITATLDVPPHDNSAVDGYAVYFEDLDPNQPTQLPVAGRAAAGHPLSHPQARGTAVRIFTGAPMPTGSGGNGPDTVMMQEDCTPQGDQVSLQPGIRRGANRRARAEDITSGSMILRAGQRLRPQDIGLAASIGLAELPVFSRLSVACFSTGDEVCDPGTPAPPGGIYDANRYCLIALLEKLGCQVTDLGILPDDLQTITSALKSAAAQHHAIVTSGGMSSGEEDHVATAVEKLGSLYFWRLAIKPGRPVALGQISQTPIIGLPGNPAAMMVTFLRIARPALLRLAGARPTPLLSLQVPAAFDHAKKSGRREFVRVSLRSQSDGIMRAHKFPREGAGVLSSLVETDGLVELPEDLTQVSQGMMVSYIPFAELLA